MRLLLYSHEHEFETDIQKIIEALVHVKENVETYHDINLVAERLCRPMPDVAIIVLVVSDDAELSKFLLLKEFLPSNDLVLVFPQGKNEMIEKSRELYPRHIFADTSSLHEFTLVLAKMLSRRHGNSQPYRMQ